MKAEENDKLKSLFQEMKLDSPSMNFENRLMAQVHVKAAKQFKCKGIKSTFAVITGVAGMMVIPSLIFWIVGIPLEADIQSLKFNIQKIQFDPLIVSIACVALLLLIGDMLIRKHIKEKKHKDR